MSEHAHNPLRRPGLPDPSPAVVHSVSAHAPQPVVRAGPAPAIGSAAVGMCVALLAAVIFFDAWTGAQNRFTYSDASARFAATLFVAIVVASLAGRLAGRSQRVFCTVFCMVAAAQVANGAHKLMRDRELRESLAQPDPLESMYKLIAQDSHDATAPAKALSEPIVSQKVAETLEQAAPSMGDQQATYARAVAAFQRTLGEPDQQLEAARQRVVKLGGLDMRKVQKRAELDTRYSAYQDLEMACAAQEKVLRNAETWLRVRLTRDGFPADQVSGAVTAFLSQARVETTLQLRDAEIKRTRVARESIAVLKARWDRWQPDTATGNPIFAEAEGTTEYRKANAEWATLSTTIAKLEQQATPSHTAEVDR